MEPNDLALIDALRLRSDERGGWAGPPFGHAAPAGAAARDGISVSVRLLEPGKSVSVRPASRDLMLLHHTGVPLEVRLCDLTGDSSTVLVGRPAADGCVPQLVVAAGTSCTIKAVSGRGAALWSEAVIPGDADNSPLLDAPNPRTAGSPSAPRGLSTGRSLRALLGLTPHVEGGYYRQTYQSARTMPTPRGERYLANSILYLLDAESPIGHLHSNASDITHFIHSPGPIKYRMLAPDGTLHERTLGTDVSAGERPVMTCPAGWWKCSALEGATEAGLISEIVAPGFDFADQEILSARGLALSHPQLIDELGPYVSAS